MMGQCVRAAEVKHKRRIEDLCAALPHNNSIPLDVIAGRPWDTPAVSNHAVGQATGQLQYVPSDPSTLQNDRACLTWEVAFLCNRRLACTSICPSQES